jgi:hypothetical protein
VKRAQSSQWIGTILASGLPRGMPSLRFMPRGQAPKRFGEALG